MENRSPCADFFLIATTLESGDSVARVSAMSHTVELLTRGEPLPDATQLHRLIASLSTILCASHSDISTNREARHTLKAIRSAITDAHTMMDHVARHNALHAIHCCWEDEAFGYILRDAADLRLLTVQAQRGALKIMQACLPRFPGHVDDVRCVVGFTSLLSSPHADVVCGCAEALMSLSPVVPGFACTVTKSYCDLLAQASSMEMNHVLMVFNQLRDLSSFIMNGSGVDDMPMFVLRALTVRDLTVRQKILDLALSLVTPWNVDNMVQFLHNEMEGALTTLEYRAMLKKAIHACRGKYLKG